MAKICFKCKEVINKDEMIKCMNQCKNTYHYFCIPIEKESFKKMKKESRQIFSCNECLTMNSQQDHLNIDIINDFKKTNDEIVNENIRDVKSQEKQILDLKNSNDGVAQNPNIQDFDSLYMLLKLELAKNADSMQNNIVGLIQECKREFRTEMNDIIALNKKNEEQITALIKLNQETNIRVTELQNQNKKLDLKLQQVTTELNNQKIEINKLNMYTRRCNLEVMGITELQNEDLKKILLKMADILKQDINDIVLAHRIPTKSKRGRSIIIKFRDVYARNNWLNIVKKTRITINQLIGIDDNKRIYVNEHLTVYNKMLFFEAKQYKIKNHFRFLWTRNGAIFLRKSPDSKVIHLEKLEDLDVI